MEAIRERFLPERAFRGRQNNKLQYAVLAAAALQGGTEPDLLDEVASWQTDDLWQYALFAAVACIRAACRAGVPYPRHAGTWPSFLAIQRHNDHSRAASPSRRVNPSATHSGGSARVNQEQSSSPNVTMSLGGHARPADYERPVSSPFTWARRRRTPSSGRCQIHETGFSGNSVNSVVVRVPAL